MNMPSLSIELKIGARPIPFVSIGERRRRHVGNYRSVSNNQKLCSARRSREESIICIISRRIHRLDTIEQARVYDNNVSSSERYSHSPCGTSTSTFLGVFVNASRPLVGELLRLFPFSRWKKPPSRAVGAWYPNSPPLRLSSAGFTFTKMPRFAICSALTLSRWTPSLAFQKKLITASLGAELWFTRITERWPMGNIKTH